MKRIDVVVVVCALAGVWLGACKKIDEEKAEKEAPAEAEKPPKYGNHTAEIASHRAILEAEPCDQRSAVKLGEVLSRAGAHQEAIDHVRGYLEKCGDYDRLRWVERHAHEELGEWEKAAEVDTALIEKKPQDADFWWWRGKARLELGRDREAAADFRQSIANQDLARSSGIAVLKLARLTPALEQPCEGAYALRHYTFFKGGDINATGRNLQMELHLKGDCDRLAGKGHAIVPLDPSTPANKVKVRVNGKPGTFLFDPKAGFTVLTRAFADRAGVSGEGPPLTTFAAAALRQGIEGTADSIALDDARADAVPVLIADELPGMDGVLGASFLWRFGLELAPDAAHVDQY